MKQRQVLKWLNTCQIAIGITALALRIFSPVKDALANEITSAAGVLNIGAGITGLMDLRLMKFKDDNLDTGFPSKKVNNKCDECERVCVG